MEIAILDFGGQYVFNIERILSELGVECKIVPYNIPCENLQKWNVKGVILSGGPYSVYLKPPLLCDVSIFNMNVPILGLCYGHQLIAYLFGGRVRRGGIGEYGFSEVTLDTRNLLFLGLNKKEICWMSHGDVVTSLPKSFTVIASTDESKIAGISLDKKIFGLQFHPEVSHTPNGDKILKNFSYTICGCHKKEWDVRDFIQRSIKNLEKNVGGEKAIIAVSGGVDSTTAALLAHKALGTNLYAVHIDHGFMRKGESSTVISNLFSLDLNVTFIDAKKRFQKALTNVEDSDEKRKIIGKLFINEFEKVAREKEVKWLIQGTIAPDVIESTRGMAKKGRNGEHGGLIKIHHNVAGLPAGMKLNLIEPLNSLFKYQVRILAKELGLSKDIVYRQPFPGPGLVCRIGGSISKEKIQLLQEIGEIIEPQLEGYHPSQYFTILVDNHREKEQIKINRIFYKYFRESFELEFFTLKEKSIGVKGDERVIGKIFCLRDIGGTMGVWNEIPWLHVLRLQNEITGSIKDVCRVVVIVSKNYEPNQGYGIILRAVDTIDYMTAIPTKISFNYLTRLSENLMKMHKEIKFVGFEITTKPAATIELI